MAVTTQSSYPSFKERLESLVQDHLYLAEEPLMLAIYYAPARLPEDVFMFEVIENFGNRSVDENKQLFEVWYATSEGFLLYPGQHLHLIFTNPHECERAMNEGWPLANELQEAIRAGRYEVLYYRPDAAPLLTLIGANAPHI